MCYRQKGTKGGGGCDLFSFPSSQKQIIQQLNHNTTHRLTSISLLKGTHLYKKFAVRERGVALHSPWHDLCASLRLLTYATPIISSTVVLSLRP